MVDTPEDRGPSSMRVVKYDPNNPIHAGLTHSRLRENNILGQSSSTNPNIELPGKAQKGGFIKMPVAPGMEEEPPKLSARYHELNKSNSTEAINKSVRKTGKVPVTPPYVPPQERGKVEEKIAPKKKTAPKKKAIIKTDAPSMAEATDVGAKYKGVIKSPAQKAKAKADAEARQRQIAASIAAKRGGKAK